MKFTKKDEGEPIMHIYGYNCDIYEKPNQHVACALRGKSDKIYIGINLKSSHSVCAEQVAIGQAYAHGEREFKTIVAVQLDNDKNLHTERRTLYGN